MYATDIRYGLWEIGGPSDPCTQEEPTTTKATTIGVPVIECYV